jgi:hypothetical protein
MASAGLLWFRTTLSASQQLQQPARFFALSKCLSTIARYSSFVVAICASSFACSARLAQEKGGIAK